jgi:hypothetical protein
LINRGKEAEMVCPLIKEAHVPDSVEKHLNTLPGLSKLDLGRLWQSCFILSQIRRFAGLRWSDSSPIGFKNRPMVRYQPLANDVCGSYRPQ